jgi:hypothetical protein
MVRAGEPNWEFPAINTPQERRNMRASKFTLSTVVLVLLSVSAWAGDKMKANIEINQTLHVGSKQLDPGDYKMTWTESGSNAAVTFSRGKKVTATVPAHVTQVRSGFHSPAIHTDSSTSTLVEVELPEVSLSFTSENTAPASPAN